MYVSTCARVIFPEVVLMGIGLPVEVLTGEPEVEDKLVVVPIRIFVGRVRPERIDVVPPPDRGGRFVRDRPWRVQLVGVKHFGVRLETLPIFEVEEGFRV